MDLLHVSDFIKLAESHNFSIAADELYITQPTLSKHIKSLEKTLGIRLFIRNTKQLRLSEAGEFFYPTRRNLKKYIKNRGWISIIILQKTSWNLLLHIYPL